MISGTGVSKCLLVLTFREARIQFYFLQIHYEFSKTFFDKNVEKKGNAIRASLSIAYPHCVNI
jgi:hypothetical protein